MPKAYILSDAAVQALTAAEAEIRASNLGFTPSQDEIASLVIASTPASVVADEFCGLFRPAVVAGADATGAEDPPLDADR